MAPFQGSAWKRRLVPPEERGLEPPEPEGTGAVCCRCRNELTRGELYGTCDGRTVCAGCLEEEWGELSDEERFSMLGFDVKRG